MVQPIDIYCVEALRSIYLMCSRKNFLCRETNNLNFLLFFDSIAGADLGFSRGGGGGFSKNFPKF